MRLPVGGPGVAAELLGGGDGGQAVQARGGLPLRAQQPLQRRGLRRVRRHRHAALRRAAVARHELFTHHRTFHCRPTNS